ncbi:acyl-CoA N-acyltransferase [Coniella lustricola]|uniref:histone acetyltransferase n=1 Tax=Coniella lustricola TaxID=2025994 RepID=A0A2T2ZS98_9PEZI|nr:acyl-CoA N-acyltransferase [Coniella lustricola]
MPQPPPRVARPSDQIAANSSKPVAPTATHASPPPPPLPLPLPLPPQQSQSQSPARPPKKKKRDSGKAPEKIKSSVVDRNIDKVVFGNVCFSTWYHSPYGAEALKEISGNSIKSSIPTAGGGGGQSSRKTKEGKLDRLYVCPSCFKYSKELVPWWQHVHLCERRAHMPGQKIYTHPKTQRTTGQQRLAGHASHRSPMRSKKTAETAHEPQDPQDPQDQGEWSIWQVDGEDEPLFCQNLSLFAKLFLDNKSVFFDVAGFHYFLLVHTTPPPPRRSADHERDQDQDQDQTRSESEADPRPPTHQVVGFFSKEKLSWDNNNLACILIFPPWQRKGLGALLMGVSYEISRREGCLGGPEKPISDLGKKGYKRFWGGEIAAWLLGLDSASSGAGGSKGEEEEVVVDVEECSQATWIVPEDCLMMLREMGVIEQAGLGPPKKKKTKKKRLLAPSAGGGSGGGGGGGDEGDMNEDKEQESADSEAERDEVKDVARVRISKDAVWEWVQTNRISLEKTCDPDGFVEGYAIKKPGIEEDDL